MADLVQCKALVEFVAVIPGYGMVVGAPGSTDDAAKNPMVPAGHVERLVADGKIEVGGKTSKAKPSIADDAPAA